MEIVHRSGKTNQHTDYLSHQPVWTAPNENTTDDEIQVAKISIQADLISDLLQMQHDKIDDSHPLSSEQLKDKELQPIILYLKEGTLPTDQNLTSQMIVKASAYSLIDGILYYIGHVSPRAVVPSNLKQSLIDEYHSGIMAGHFSGPRVYQEMSQKWWWHQMYHDILNTVKCCPQCATVTGPGRKQLPPLQSIPVDHPFQIVGVDIMELPLATNGNKYAIIFQDLFTKWPMVYSTPDQKVERIAKLLTQEIIPMFGVPGALLPDRGTNLL